MTRFSVPQNTLRWLWRKLASSIPNQTEMAYFDAVRMHFNAAEIAEMVAVIAAFGFLNRWNDTLATPLEESPLAFAEAHLAATGWTPGRHK